MRTVLKKEQELFSSTLRFSDFRIPPSLACSSSLVREGPASQAGGFSIPVYRPSGGGGGGGGGILGYYLH